MNAVLDEYWQAYLWTDGLQLTGLAMTLWLLILAVALGFLLAIPLAVARTCGNPLLRYPVWLYTYVFRGTLVVDKASDRTVADLAALSGAKAERRGDGWVVSR